MARFVTFNGITQFRAGGITKVDASALARAGLSINGLIGLIGESDGGSEPGTVVTIDDPTQAKDSFRSGPLADAIGLAFDPSDDPDVPAGAFRCYCVRTNQGTRASRILYNKVAEDVTAAGSTSTSIVFPALAFTANEHAGSIARIGTYAAGAWSGYTDSLIISNTTTTLTITAPGFVPAPPISTTVHIFAPQVTLYSKEYSLAANATQQEYEPGASIGQSWTTNFEGTTQISNDIGGISYFDLEYNGQSQLTTLDSGTTDGAGATTTTVDSTKTWVLNAFAGFFEYVSGGALAQPNLRKIASNTTGGTATVTNAFTSAAAPTAPGIGATYSVRTGAVYAGTAGFTAVGASTATLEADIDVAVNELAGLVLMVTGPTTSPGYGQKRAITSNTAGVSPVLTLDEPWGSDYLPVATDDYEIRYVTTATATITGAAGLATTLTTSVDVNGAGAATDLNITFPAGQTVQELVTAINANSNYLAYVPNGVNGNTTLMRTFDFDGGSLAVDIRNSREAVLAPPTYTYSVPVVWKNHFRRELQVFVDSINSSAEFVTAVKNLGAGTGSGGGRPEFTGGVIGSTGDSFVYLTGGTRGTSINSNWQTAFDLLLQIRCTSTVPLISEDLTNQGYGSTADFASIAAQLASHVSMAAGVSKSERGGYMGKKGTLDQLVTQANTFNSADVQLTGQRVTRLNTASTLAEMDEWSTAVIAAGMRAGVPEVGEPLTWKYFRTTALDQDSSWDPADDADANRMIENGILFAQTISGKGTRWERDLTTYILDDNLAHMTGSTRDVVRYVAYGLRNHLEDKFTGKKAKPANASSIKEETAAYLELARGEDIIVDSEDPDTGVLTYAFHNIRVTISGNVASIKVGIFPVVGIDFELTEIYVQLPQSSA